MNQSEELTQFYQDYYAWIMSMMYGSGMNPNKFNTRHGLCDNLYQWCEAHKLEYAKLSREMVGQFADAGLALVLPFDQWDADKGRHSYQEAKYNQTQHLNPKRIEWVKAHAQI